jgi:hypothetical protein
MKTCFAACLVGLLASSAIADTTLIDFDSGWQGFSGDGNSVINPAGGNPGAHAQTIHNNFGIEWSTQSNPAFVGDFSQYSSVTISIDVKAEQIAFFGSPVSRNLILDLRSFSLAQGGYPWASVWYNMGTMQGGMPWTTFSVTFNPNSPVMPAGWGGSGAEDPNTFEPILPPNLTFAQVLANVEELSFTTYEPGFFYGFTDFNIRIDNIRIEVVPIPAPGALALLGLAGLASRRRR